MALLGWKTQSVMLRRGGCASTASPRLVVTQASLKPAADVASAVASTSRRGLLLSGVSMLTLAVMPAQAADTAELGVEEYARLEETGKLNSAKALDNIRAKYNFKRNPDGRVYAKSSKGTYFAVRLDMEAPGGLLFRDTSSGEIYALQTPALQQVDLTSDQVVILILGDGEWETSMSPITLEDDNGKVKTLTMTESEFRNVLGLISMTEGGQEGNDNTKS